MKQSELRKMIKEVIINEANWHSLVAKVSDACGGKYSKIQDFIKALLINSDFHNEAEKVDNFMNKI